VHCHRVPLSDYLRISQTHDESTSHSGRVHHRWPRSSQAGLQCGAHGSILRRMSSFVRKHPALSLFLVALAFGPALVAPVLAGWLRPSFLQLGALSASVAGFVVAAVESGKPGVRELLGRARIWKVGRRWWLAALLLPLVPAMCAIYAAAVYTTTPTDWSRVGPWYSVIQSMLILIVAAGLGEEFGWRGFALPRLCSRHTALVATFIVGAFHAVWHLPLFFIKSEAYHAYAEQLGLLPAFLGYAIFVIALAFQLSWIFINTGGSVLMAAVYHGASNAWAGYLAIDRGGLAGPLALVATNVALSLVLVVFQWRPTQDRAGRSRGQRS
jgi:uncharacterized protein